MGLLTNSGLVNNCDSGGAPPSKKLIIGWYGRGQLSCGTNSSTR
ncbi:Uncharacterised protein [Mycobacteroides abscessus subsp. abscessus]|nr:Uncharacterised protein [Mycobacteroides abscessus subsp. abscessus]